MSGLPGGTEFFVALVLAALVFAAARNVSTTPGILTGAGNMMRISP